MHRDGAERCPFGDFHTARRPATAAIEADTLADRQAMQAFDFHRRHDEQAADPAEV